MALKTVAFKCLLPETQQLIPGELSRSLLCLATLHISSLRCTGGGTIHYGEVKKVQRKEVLVQRRRAALDLVR